MILGLGGGDSAHTQVHTHPCKKANTIQHVIPWTRMYNVRQNRNGCRCIPGILQTLPNYARIHNRHNRSGYIVRVKAPVWAGAGVGMSVEVLDIVIAIGEYVD